MTSPRRASLTTAGLMVALLLGFGVLATPAVAEETIPTTTTVTKTGSSSIGDQATVTATVTSAAGVPTGTVQFWEGSTAIGQPVPVDAAGVATTVVTVSGYGLTTYRGTFTGSGGFADSSGQTFAFGQRVNVWLVPQPFMTRPNPLLVRYGLTTQATRPDGSPIPGLVLEFTYGSTVSPSLFEMRPPGSKLACQAVTDANGVASCGLFQSLAALQSRLNIWVAHQRTGVHEFAVAKVPFQ